MEADNEIVRPLITRVDDRVRLNPITSGNNGKGRIFVGVPDGGIILRSLQEYLGADNVIENRSLVRLKYSETRPFNPRQYQPPTIFVVVNNNYVEREKWKPKENPFYMNSEFLLEKGRLPSEINRKLKTNRKGKKDRSVSNHAFTFDDNYRKQLYKSCTDLAFEVELGPRSILYMVSDPDPPNSFVSDVGSQS
ncbi:hypothetical protein CQW23_32184 [Capsicum baccatum]|uniref:Uncharacterized protein n=1 Tax=Capsicum baccatum TaxID=33114 RepID=A0A2G2V5E8_CAPBA|nr:hypothetical protein CQW23_35404 [Capsicum baccatum]PHT28213.1 hypothetical protein CQW23_32184 [Capsicum baccatum]